MSIKRIGILVGGGPAPGTNGVISAVVIEAIKAGCVPVGFHDGFEWLAQRYTDEQHEMTIPEVARIHLGGGVHLGTSRADITRDRAALENAVAALRKLNIEALVTVGGDDLVRSSAAVERETRGDIRVAQVPKSIDNDLWLPLPVATLGHETARHVGVELVKRLMEDAKTTGRWYLGVTMGRPTGHLTLGIGKAASATCTIIPEEFPAGRVSLSDVADIVEGTVIKRRAMGRPYGVVLLAEALVERFDPLEVAELQDVDRDAQGQHPRRRDRPRPQGQERGAGAARTSRHQGDHRGQDHRLRAALRPAHPVRRRVRARPRLRRLPPSRLGRHGRDDHDSGRRVPGRPLRGGD
jgi:6-phosphofructokinase